jgi:tetratricopeptide (TPR) repeat protein
VPGYAQSPAWQNFNNQGQSAYQHGKMKEAEGFFQESITEARQSKTKDGWLAMSLNNLGNVYCAESKYAEAIPLFDECVAILKSQPGVTPVMVASALNNLANAYQGAGQVKEAESTYRTALSANQKSTDPKRSLMGSLVGLANVLIAQKKYPEAKSLIDQAVAYGEKHPEQDQRGLSTAYSESADLAMHNNDLKSAEALFLKASLLDEKLYGNNSAQKAADLNNLAAVRERQGKTTEAEALYQKANQVAAKSDTNKEGSLQTLINLANFSNEHHQTDKAVVYMEQALPLAISVLGDDSSDVVQLKNNLACLYINQSRFDDAEKLLFSAIVSAQDMKNPPLDTLATSCNNLGNALYKQQKYDEAEMLLERAVNFREKLSGANDPSVGLAVNNLAQAYSAAGKYSEAEPLFKRAISILEKSNSARRDLKDCYQNYAAMQQLAGNQDEARQLASKAQTID